MTLTSEELEISILRRKLMNRTFYYYQAFHKTHIHHYPYHLSMCQLYHICLEFPGLISILNVWRNKTVYSRVVSSRVVRGSTGDWGVTGTELSLTVGHTGGVTSHSHSMIFILQLSIQIVPWKYRDFTPINKFPGIEIHFYYDGSSPGASSLTHRSLLYIIICDPCDV